MLFAPARPFRTFQNKVWVSSNRAQQRPGSRIVLTSLPAALRASPPGLGSDSKEFFYPKGGFFFPVSEDRRGQDCSVILVVDHVSEAAAALHVAVLCLLCGFALLPPSQQKQLLLCRSSEPGVGVPADLPASDPTAAYDAVIPPDVQHGRRRRTGGGTFHSWTVEFPSTLQPFSDQT